MSNTDTKKPTKGILRKPSNTSTPSKDKAKAKWDEMNIISTLHPADKDYGYMKVDEPPTPYNYDYKPGEEQAVDPAVLAKKLQQSSTAPSKREKFKENAKQDELTPEEQEHKNLFQSKRKSHYNEFQYAKTALLPDEIELEVPSASGVLYCGVENCPGHNPASHEKCPEPKGKSKKFPTKRKSQK